MTNSSSVHLFLVNLFHTQEKLSIIIINLHLKNLVHSSMTSSICSILVRPYLIDKISRSLFFILLYSLELEECVLICTLGVLLSPLAVFRLSPHLHISHIQRFPEMSNQVCICLENVSKVRSHVHVGTSFS